YQAFEAAITADYDAQSAVERELVLRLASVLWRLRRAPTMETGLFAVQADHSPGRQQGRRPLPGFQKVIPAAFPPTGGSNPGGFKQVPELRMIDEGPTVEFARCFLRLANLPNFALDRLSRYEANLWRQAGRILYALETLDRRKPQERSRRYRVGEQKDL